MRSSRVEITLVKEDEVLKTVTIPACEDHGGYRRATLTLKWECPVCGGPRGEVFSTLSYDGSRRMNVDGWTNPCGHIDKYVDVRNEARQEVGR